MTVAVPTSFIPPNQNASNKEKQESSDAQQRMQGGRSESHGYGSGLLTGLERPPKTDRQQFAMKTRFLFPSFQVLSLAQTDLPAQEGSKGKLRIDRSLDPFRM